MKRREFIAGLGAAAWPLLAQSQQMTTIGYLDVGSSETRRDVVADVRRGLAEMGFVEGRNLVIEYRWAPGDSLSQLPKIAADLVDRRVAAIIAMQRPVALAAKSATKSIPIVFSVAVDPVEAGIVASLNRPGGNLTGMTLLVIEVAAKRLEILHEVAPSVRLIAFLTNPLLNPSFIELEKRELESASQTLGLQLLMIHASKPDEFQTAFTTLIQAGAGGLVVSGAAFFSGYSERLVALAADYKVPTIYGRHELAVAGGLMSYGTDLSEVYRQVGAYAGRVLKGEMPADLPVQQVTKMRLTINMNAAKALGLTFPLTLLGRADEVIE
jgi:putative tryptophan/tyrosine transport system substrate-binding protein